MLITPTQPQRINSKISTNSSKSAKRRFSSTFTKKSSSSTQKKSKRKVSKGNPQNVPKARVALEMKLQKTIRQNADEKLNSNEEHTKNLLQSKQMLEEILEEYDHISKDKTILAAEIKNMKKYLSEIRLKLDKSLLILSKNTTLFAMKKGLIGKLIRGKRKINSISKEKRSNKTIKSIQ